MYVVVSMSKSTLEAIRINQYSGSKGDLEDMIAKGTVLDEDMSKLLSSIKAPTCLKDPERRAELLERYKEE